MKNKNNLQIQSISVFMIALIILMPISSMSVFAETGLTVTFSVPEMTKQPEQNITITSNCNSNLLK